MVGAAYVGFAACMAMRPIADNSFFTHVATGRLILDAGSVPSVDPYSFTAHGEPWVVQSWLVSLLYGLVESWAGSVGLRLLTGIVVGALMALVWRLTRPAVTLASRIIVAGIVLVVGLTFWVPRPLLFGLLLFALLLVIVEEARDPRWLVPIMWLWVNSHGSFPLALVAIAALGLGRKLDGEDPRVEIRAFLWALGGTLLGAIGPIGPKLLLFPLTVLSRMEVLQRVIEWQSPNFTQSYARLFLAQVVVATIAVVRRPSYRALVPLLVFVVAALFGLRNIPLASLVIVPGLALGLKGIGSLDGRERGPVPMGALAVVVVLSLFGASTLLSQPTFDLATYPVAGAAWLEDQGWLTGSDARVATSDVNGNFLELVSGTAHQGYFDDRYDMYPLPFMREYLTLDGGLPGWNDILRRQDIDVVMWAHSSPLTSLLAESPEWKVRYVDDSVVIACRRDSTRVDC